MADSTRPELPNITTYEFPLSRSEGLPLHDLARSSAPPDRLQQSANWATLITAILTALVLAVSLLNPPATATDGSVGGFCGPARVSPTYVLSQSRRVPSNPWVARLQMRSPSGGPLKQFVRSAA
jgi:hypothetical protein